MTYLDLKFALLCIEVEYIIEISDRPILVCNCCDAFYLTTSRELPIFYARFVLNINRVVH